MSPLGKSTLQGGGRGGDWERGSESMAGLRESEEANLRACLSKGPLQPLTAPRWSFDHMPRRPKKPDWLKEELVASSVGPGLSLTLRPQGCPGCPCPKPGCLDGGQGPGSLGSDETAREGSSLGWGGVWGAGGCSDPGLS